MSSVRIKERRVGPGEPVYVVAEMSANHGGSFDRAISIIRAAAEAGVDAVKLQTYTPDTLTIDCGSEHFRIGPGTVWQDRRLYELYAEACTPWEWQPLLKEEAETLGLDLFSTPFDSSAVDFLEAMEVPAYKVASFEIVDLELLRRIGATQKPVILSTGMASLAEIEEAVTTLRAAGSTELVLLKCTSAYPAPHCDMNLRTIPHLSQTFGVPAGVSDHTLGVVVPLAAVALGACVIEKHFTLSRADGGPDSAFSLEPAEMKALVEAVRQTEEALGTVSYRLTSSESASRVFRRSLFAVEDVPEGGLYTSQNVRSIRPGVGLHPRHLGEVLGRRATCPVRRGTPLSWDLVGS